MSKLDKLMYEGDAEFFSGEHELMGTWEVAKYLGVEKSRIARWMSTGAIVAPVARLRAGPFWTFEQIRQKAREMYRAQMGVSPSTLAELDEWLEARRAKKERAKEAAAV